MNLPFEIEGVDSNKLVMHAKVEDLQRPIEIKSDGATINANAGITGTPAAQAVWGTDYLLVTHMNQSGMNPARDSTAHANHGTAIGGPIAVGTVFNTFHVHLNGSQGYQFPNIPEYDVTGEFTIIGVCSLDVLGGTAKTIATKAPANSAGWTKHDFFISVSQYAVPPWADDMALLGDINNDPHQSSGGPPVVVGNPSVFALTRNAANLFQAHNNGVISAGITKAGTLSRGTGGIYLGCVPRPGGPTVFMQGPYSEFRYLKKRIPDDEINLTYQALANNLYDISIV